MGCCLFQYKDQTYGLDCLARSVCTVYFILAHWRCQVVIIKSIDNTNFVFFSVMKVWVANISGQVEAVVGPYKLYDFFYTLQGTEWLTDEVRLEL